MKQFIAKGVEDFQWGSQPKELLIKAEECGDEYHTIEELYNHRMALNVALFNLISEKKNDLIDNFCDLSVYKSKLHNDGTMFEGDYFIVSLYDSARYQQISYHYKLEHWDKFKIPEVKRIPWKYDFHSPDDVISRLLAL